MGPQFLHLPKSVTDMQETVSEFEQKFVMCNAKGDFIDIDCRWLGSVHDAKVFANSTITRKFREGSLAGTLHEVLPGY